MEFSNRLLLLFNKTKQNFALKLEQLQGFLETKYPKLRELPFGRYASRVLLAVTALAVALVVIVSTSSSARNTNSSTSRHPITLAGKNFSGIENLTSQNRGIKFNEVCNAIWDGFYGKKYRKPFFNVKTYENNGKQWIFVRKYSLESDVDPRTYNPESDAKLDRTAQERGMARSIDSMDSDMIESHKRQFARESRLFGEDYAQRRLAEEEGVNADKMFNALGIQRTKNSFLTDDEVIEKYNREVLSDANFMASENAKSILAIKGDSELLNHINSFTSDPEEQEAVIQQVVMRRMIKAVDGVKKAFASKNPDKMFFVNVLLELSVNDQIYRHWKDSSLYLLRQFAVSKDDAVAKCWLAGMWFGLDDVTGAVLNSLKANPGQLLQRVAKLNIWVEALDAKGNVVMNGKKPLRECIPLDRFRRVKSKIPLPIGARPDDIFELGRLSDFNREDQATARKKILVEGKEALIEEVYVSSFNTTVPVEKANDTAVATGAIFEMDDYVVTKIVNGGIVANKPQQRGAEVFLETPLKFAKGDKLPKGYVKYISRSSQEGRNIRHFRQVICKDASEGFHGKVFKDNLRNESAFAWVLFDSLSEEVAGSINSIKCWIEETEDDSRKQ